MNTTTKYIPITPLNFHSEIRVDTMGDEIAVSVYNCDIHHLDLLIQQLEALKAEYAPKSNIIPVNMGAASLIEYDENDEPKAMVAVMGKKVDPTAWYGKALRKQAAELTKQDAITKTIVNRTAQGFSPKAIAHQVKKQTK